MVGSWWLAVGGLLDGLVSGLVKADQLPVPVCQLFTHNAVPNPERWNQFARGSWSWTLSWVSSWARFGRYRATKWVINGYAHFHRDHAPVCRD